MAGDWIVRKAGHDANRFLLIIMLAAAGLIEIAIAAGAKTIEVNLEETPASHAVDIALHGQAGTLLPQLVG